MPAPRSQETIIISLLLLACHAGCISPVAEKYYAFEYRNSEGLTEKQELEYAVLNIKPVNAEERLPLLVVLHGRGDAGWSYLEQWREEAENARFMVLAPSWETAELPLQNLLGLIEKVVKKYPVDPKRIYLAGCSAGALKARRYLLEDPPLWAGVILISSPTEQWGTEIKDGSLLPDLLFAHGKQDPQMPYQKILSNLEILKTKGVQATLIAYPEGKHEQEPQWTKDIMAWLQQRGQES